MKNKGQIFIWALYDWANSAFSTIIVTFIFAYYFTNVIAPDAVKGTTQWGNAQAIAGVFIAFLSPIFGSIADYSGQRRRWLSVFTLLCVVASAGLWLAWPSPDWSFWTLSCLIVGTVALEVGMVFYNAMLPLITKEAYFGRVSGWAWGFGYFGGLLSLVVALYGFVKYPPASFDTQQFEQVRICGPFVAIWLLVFALPLMLAGPTTQRTRYPWGQALQLGLSDLKNTIRSLTHYRSVLWFLLARLFYIDGLNTVFSFGGIYAGGTFGLDASEVIEFGIAMNVTAGLGAFVFGWLDDFWGPKPTILVSLAAMLGLGVWIVMIHWIWLFIVLALIIGLFVGPIQSASRSLMAHLVPRDKTNEFFGLYSLSGKITAFLGPALLAEMTALSQSQRVGMASILIFFVLGGALLFKVELPAR